LIFGLILILCSTFEIDDITKLKIKPYHHPLYWALSLGLILVVISIYFYRNSELLFLFNTTKVKKVNNEYIVTTDKANIKIHFGKIEEVYNGEDSSSVVVLPANEFFDDDCINDKRSALGSFMQEKFGNRIHEIQQLINEQLSMISSIQVEKETGKLAKSYGIGTCLFLDCPLLSNYKIILVSVTTKRAKEGLLAEIPYVFEAIKKIHEMMLDKRLSVIFCPVLGSGHGVLKKEVAFFSLILAFSEALKKPSGQHIHTVNIVIFKKNNSKPDISQRVAKRLLRSATSMMDY
jgi:hypothetical protein